MRLMLHDAHSIGRHLLHLDLLLQPGESDGDYRAVFDLRDTVLSEGRTLWLTCLFDQDVAVKLGSEETALLVAPAEDERVAKRLWRQWELRSARDRLESLSEPRPWRTIDGDPSQSWWLRLASPQYGHLEDGLRLLRKHFPDDAVVNSWFQYTHPRMPNPAADLRLPKDGEAPRWAVLSQAALMLYKEFIDWWIDHRQLPNGELGCTYQDDTDLLQDWLDLALITNPGDKYSDSLARLAEGVSTTYRRRGAGVSPAYRKEGASPITHGLNVRRWDVLHAYEEGLNILGPDFVAHYGDPVRLQRLLDASSRYENFLLVKENGMWRFAGDESREAPFIHTETPPSGSRYHRFWHLITHPGLTLYWHQQHPKVLELFHSLANWRLKDERARETLSSPGYGGSAFSLGVYQMTGEERYLSNALDEPLYREGTLRIRGAGNEFKLYKFLTDYDREKTLALLRENEATRFEALGTERLGWGDERHLLNWAQWHLTRDKKELIPALEHLYRRMKFTMPALTEAEQSNDRVAIPKQLLSMMYLGSVASARNGSFYPQFAVSYQGLGDQYAALVLKDQPRSLKVLFYNFEEQPQSGTMRLWNLEPGDYEVTAGFDDDDDDTIDKVTYRKTVTVERAAGVAIELPSRRPWIVSLRQVKPGLPLAKRVDVGVSARQIRVEGETLVVPVYNTGILPVAEFKVRLRTLEGEILEERTVEKLAANPEWKLTFTEVRFPLPIADREVVIELDPGRELSEITRVNNQVRWKR